MKKLLALLIALVSAWVLFLPFDLPPFPFFFLDEALALVLLTKSLRYLGFDIAPLVAAFATQEITPCRWEYGCSCEPSEARFGDRCLTYWPVPRRFFSKDFFSSPVS